MLIRFDNCTINTRFITSVRVSESPERVYSVRLRTLDGREYVEAFDNRAAAEKVKTEIVAAMRQGVDHP